MCPHVLHPANVVLSRTQGTISSGRLNPFHFLPRSVHPDLQIREVMLQKCYIWDEDDLILVSGSIVGCSCWGQTGGEDRVAPTTPSGTLKISGALFCGEPHVSRGHSCSQVLFFFHSIFGGTGIESMASVQARQAPHHGAIDPYAKHFIKCSKMNLSLGGVTKNTSLVFNHDLFAKFFSCLSIAIS